MRPSVNFKFPFLSIITTEWVELLFYNQEILGTDFRPATVCFKSIFFRFAKEIPRLYLKQGHNL